MIIRPISIALTMAIILMLTAAAPAQVPSIAPPQVNPPAGEPEVGAKTPEMPAQQAHALTKEDVEAWLDGFLPSSLQRNDVAGAVVVVIKDNQVLLAKGYGYADVAAKKPVDPETTLFRAGSVSKLYTWTGVMQLVEQGKIDLDADVNNYLDFKIPSRGEKPVTIRNLMTHTPGFDEAIRALIVSDPHALQKLGDQLKRWVPPRVTDAGSTPAYSNYGAALAGYIVERLSGESFDEYIEHHIFAPLGMKYATFRQPLPKELEPYMAKGYKVASGKPQPFEIVTIAPAGSISISGDDMARFAIAHLQNGAFENQHILQEATAIKMHSTGNDVIPPLHRMLLGFYESDINGHRVISHGGDTEFFHSDFNLYPDDKAGLYISMNSLGKEAAAHTIRTMLLREFSDRYFPGPAPEGKVDAETAKKDAQMMTGRYVLSRRPHTSFLSLLNLMGQTKVAPGKEGGIVVSVLKDAAGNPRKWREVGPMLWRDQDSNERLAAKVENNRVVRWGVDAFPFMIFEPAPCWLSSAWLLPLFIFSGVVLVLTFLAWPTSALVRRHYGATYGLSGLDAKAHRWIRLVSLGIVVTISLWFFTVTKMLSDLAWASPSLDAWIIFLRVLALIVFLGGAAIAVWNAYVVLRSNRRKLAKLWSMLIALSCLTMLYVGIAFHLTGFTANY
jgi:CubicO group peptidase (beta-lactamase class C family)